MIGRFTDMTASLISNIKKHKTLYIMSIPGILYFIVFKYIPLAGTIIAFQDYNIFEGMMASEFVGLKHFKLLFEYGEFRRILLNTMVISFYDMTIGFIAPIILALLINEVTNSKVKNFIQQTVYVPHFLSWTILGGLIITQILSPQTGMLNQMLINIGIIEEPIFFMVKEEYARGIVIFAGLWRNVGWGTILYLAAMTSINPNLYEAASVDGATRLRQVFAITLPALLPVITVLFLLRIGHFLDYGFERIWVFMNAANRPKLEIFDTYIYQSGLKEGRFSYATAIGVFKSVVGFTLLYIGNKLSTKSTGEGLY